MSCYKPAVFILSLFDTGLYAAQLLGEQGIPVFGFDHNPSNPGFYSKYIKPFLVKDPTQDHLELLNLLVKHAQALGCRPILIAASEIYLNFLHENRRSLEEHFIITLPEQNVLSNIINKAGQLHMAKDVGICVPDYWVIRNLTDLNTLGSMKLRFPIIIKGEAQQIWKAEKLNKSYIADSLDELMLIGAWLLERKLPFIAQVLISGPITNNFEYNALMLDGNIIEESVIRKIRQYPEPFGAATCVETSDNKDVERMGRDFVIKNRIEGFSNTEFKYNPVDGLLYFIETNARVWLQIKLTKALGQNFLMKYYNLILGTHNEKTIIVSGRTVKWVDVFGDLMYLFRDHKSIICFFKIVLSYWNVVSYGLIYFKDIKPLQSSFRKLGS